jgi:hypothetical protein
MCDDEKSSSPKSSSNNKGANAVSVAVLIAGMGLAVASAALMATASQFTIYYAAYGGGVRRRAVTYSDYAPFVYALHQIKTNTHAFIPTRQTVRTVVIVTRMSCLLHAGSWWSRTPWPRSWARSRCS